MEVVEKNRLRVSQVINQFVSKLGYLKLQERKEINACKINKGFGIVLCYRLENI